MSGVCVRAECTIHTSPGGRRGKRDLSWFPFSVELTGAQTPPSMGRYVEGTLGCAVGILSARKGGGGGWGVGLFG